VLLGQATGSQRVKEVVAEIALNPNTVLKAYRELEVRGLVEGKQGVGTFVLARPTGPPPGTQERLSRSLQAWVRKARDEGLDDPAVEALVRSALAPAASSAKGAA
jgi:GntR family transcriptional regulator